MITEIPLNVPHIFAFEVSEKLVEEDYAVFRPKLERLLETERPLSLLIKLRDFGG
ncbi:MAG TPA: STAS/SEC14 domain-containing protein [Leucothrix sp.]|nr:STAS/SEC14 domain-containing protein [Leucothrix sp.]